MEELSTEEAIKLFETLIDTFQTDGWKEFIKDIEHKFTTAKDGAFLECDTGDKWHYRRGVVDILAFIVSYEDQIRNSYDSINE